MLFFKKVNSAWVDLNITFILIFLISLNVSSPTVTAQFTVNEGTIDLTEFSFDENSFASLNGEWEFYWEQFLISDQFDNQEFSLRNFTDTWGSDLPSFGYATYRLNVTLPENRPVLSLQIPDFYSSYALFANDNLVAQNGKVGTSKDSYTPKWIPQTVLLGISDTNKVELILHVANFHHQRGGAYEPILLGETNILAQKREQELAYSYILTGILCMTGFFFLGLYLFGKQEKAILYFSIFCLIYSYRIIGFGIYPLHFLFPDIPWIVTLKLEYLTLFLSGLFFGIYTLKLYPKETSKLLINILSGISLVFILSVLVLPVYWFTQLVTPYFIILIAYILYAFWVYINATIKKRDGSRFALASTCVVFVVFLYEMMVYFGFTSGSMIFNFLGYLFFFSLQSLVLTYRFSSSLKRATEKAEAASRAKSQFLSTMSHEIRTPLNAIIGLSGLLGETPLNSTQEDYIKTVKISGENLLSIINNILDYSKIESSKIELQKNEVNIQELIENVLDVVAPLNTNTNVELIYDIDDSLSSFLFTDQVKLQQILINLINNAVKFTHQGEVFIQLKMDKLASKKLNRLHISITDTGIGISKKGLEKLFKSFSQVDGSTTRKYGGTGLGLVISKRLIEALGGDISVESEEEQGTKFSFYIDVESSSKSLTPYRSSILKGKKALILDDNPTNLKIFEQQGLSHGLEIDITSDPAFITKNLDSLDKYDFVILDMQMPLKDGVDVAKEIRTKWDKISLPLVLLSSIHAIEEKSELLLFNLQLTKPVKQSQLFRNLESLFKDSTQASVEISDLVEELDRISDINILVAEDNIFNQKVAEKILERLGHRPTIAENGKEAFDEVLANNYDIVFMDVEMPVLDGIEATKTIRESSYKLEKRPIIIAMTANALAEDKQMCLDAGMDDFIAKPVTIEAIDKVIKKWV